MERTLEQELGEARDALNLAQARLERAAYLAAQAQKSAIYNDCLWWSHWIDRAIKRMEEWRIG